MNPATERVRMWMCSRPSVGSIGLGQGGEYIPVWSGNLSEAKPYWEDKVLASGDYRMTIDFSDLLTVAFLPIKASVEISVGLDNLLGTGMIESREWVGRELIIAFEAESPSLGIGQAVAIVLAIIGILIGAAAVLLFADRIFLRLEGITKAVATTAEKVFTTTGGQIAIAVGSVAILGVVGTIIYSQVTKPKEGKSRVQGLRELQVP